VNFDSIDCSSAAARVVSSALYYGMEASGRRDARLLLRSSRDDVVFGFLGYPIGEDVLHSHFVLLVRAEVYIYKFLSPDPILRYFHTNTNIHNNSIHRSPSYRYSNSSFYFPNIFILSYKHPQLTILSSAHISRFTSHPSTLLSPTRELISLEYSVFAQYAVCHYDRAAHSRAYLRS
jgi:hypothetical protein